VAARQRDLLDGPIAFGRQEGSVSDAVITLTTRHTEIAGLLKSAGDASMLNYVIAFPRNRELWAAGPRRVRVTRPATDGRFHFVDLPAGDYRVAVLTELPSDWQTSTFLEQASASAVAVQVADGDTTTLELQAAK